MLVGSGEGKKGRVWVRRVRHVWGVTVLVVVRMVVVDVKEEESGVGSGPGPGLVPEIVGGQGPGR
jgi:hypothetical protein